MKSHVIGNSLLLFAMLMFAIATGCAGDKSAKPRRDYEFATTQPTYNQQGNAVWSTRRDQDVQEHPIGGIQQKPTAITEGPAPLVYILDLGGHIRVVDLSSNLTIATATAPPHSLVRIDDVHGVAVGSQNVLPGPLPAGHRYAIYLEPETTNTVRQSTGGTGLPPQR